MFNNVLLASSSSGLMVMVVYIVIIVAFFYFFMIRPQKKEQAQKEALINSIAIGDSVLTTAGFYGVVIDIMDEIVIVEFGSNKNCRIPMKKTAIIEVEKKND
jgi:preprotein translocase subunit YajC